VTNVANGMLNISAYHARNVSLSIGGDVTKYGYWRIVVDREGEYAATLLCVGGPPATRPKRNLSSGHVEWQGMTDIGRSAYSTWATKVRHHAIDEKWIESPTELFGWITGFLAWYDNNCTQPEERYHARLATQ